MGQPLIESLLPNAGVEGGEIVIACNEFRFATHDQVRVAFGEVQSRPVSASLTRIVAPVPSEPAVDGKVEVTIGVNGTTSDGKQFVIGRKLAENLHPVANPAYDRDTGAIYTTLSGSRGQKMPVSVYKITLEGDSEPFLTDIVNPTAIAFSPDGEMFITSRYDGSVCRVTPFKEGEVFGRNMGVATGITFDQEGKMYVGDRNGTVYVVNEIGEATAFATMEPSISAFHLGFGPDGYLYATGPTMSSFDSILKINKEGEVTRFFTGLGRPQGLAFDRDGNVYVAASRRGHRGIIRITPDAEAEIVVAGASLVGLCFDDRGNMIVASNHEIFRVQLGIEGYWPF
jgi:sugar lactone lactonase YvrE